MDRNKIALENHLKGYNCAQSVLCAFADKTEFTEDQLFRLSEAFGAGMGGGKNVCGAVSAMVILAGLENSKGTDALPETNKKLSYAKADELITEFENINKSVICRTIKEEKVRSCNGCIEDAVKILEDKLYK